MGRLKKQRGNMRIIPCIQCATEGQTGYHADLVLRKAEVTPDWFVSYDPEVEEYDEFFCSKDCLLEYIRGNLSE